MKLFSKKALLCSLALFTMCFTLCMSAERTVCDGVSIDSTMVDSIVCDSIIKMDTISVDSIAYKDTTSLEISPEEGKWTATYYGNTYKGIRHTANGEKFNMNNMTCAAPNKYKFGTYLRVENIANGKSVVVRVTDRGAFGNRCIDLTYGSFGKIASHRTGRIKINVYNLGINRPG